MDSSKGGSKKNKSYEKLISKTARKKQSTISTIAKDGGEDKREAESINEDDNKNDPNKTRVTGEYEGSNLSSEIDLMMPSKFQHEIEKTEEEEQKSENSRREKLTMDEHESERYQVPSLEEEEYFKQKEENEEEIEEKEEMENKKTKAEEKKRRIEREIKAFFEHTGFDKNVPFTEKEIEEFEKDLDYENDTPKERILFVPAKRFTNFNYHSVLQTYVPYTVDLSHMSLLSLDGIEFLHFVCYVNASNNLLTDKGLKYVEGIDDLILLILEKNDLTVLNLPKVDSLILLDVSRNKISWIHDNFELPNLETLIADFNLLKDITKLGKETLPKLKHLSVRCNFISDQQVSWPRRLTRLYLGQNDIVGLKWLEGLTNLKTLNLRENKICTVKDLPKDLISLEYLNLRSNQIMDVFDARYLKDLPKLTTLIMYGNPCTFQGESQDSYRLIVISYLPKLIRFDKKKITEEEKEKAKQFNKIFGDDNDMWRYGYRYNEEGEVELEIEVESPDNYETDEAK